MEERVIVLHVIRQPLVLDELLSLYTAPPPWAAWRVTLHAQCGSRSIPLNILFRDTSMQIRNGKHSWNFATLKEDPRLSMTPLIIPKNASPESAFTLICPLRDDLKIHLSAIQARELDLQDSGPIHYERGKELIARYISMPGANSHVFERLIMHSEAPLRFPLDEKAAVKSHGISYWRFTIPSDPIIESLLGYAQFDDPTWHS